MGVSQKFFQDLRDLFGYLGFQSTSLKVLDWKTKNPVSAHVGTALLGILFGVLTGVIIGVAADLTPGDLWWNNYVDVGVIVGLVIAGLVLRLAPRLERKVDVKAAVALALLAAVLFASTFANLGDTYTMFATFLAGFLVALVLGKVNFLGGFVAGTAMFFGEMGGALGSNITDGVVFGAAVGGVFGALLAILTGANAYVRSAIYSPKSDALKIEKMKAKLPGGGGNLTGALINLNMAAMRLYGYYSKKDMPEPAAELANSLSNEFKSLLGTADMGEDNLSERDRVHLQVMSSYWESQTTSAIARKSVKEGDELEEKVHSYLSASKNEEALQVLQDSLKAKRSTGDVAGAVQTLREMADVKKRAGDLEGAVETLRAAAADYPQLWFDVGFQLGEMGRHQDSIAAYQNFLRVAPGSASALNNIGVGFQNLSDLTQALDYYSKALEADPKMVTAAAGRGAALWGLGRAEEAVESYKQAAELDPKNAAYPWVLSALYHDKLQDYQKAAEYAQKAVDADPKNPGTITNLAESLLAVGKYQEAKTEAIAALQFDLEPSWRLAMLFTIACSDLFEGKFDAGTARLKEFANYRASLPATFVNTWGYDGDTTLVERSNMPTERKRDLFEALRSIGVSVPTFVPQ